MPDWQPNTKAKLKDFWETTYRSSTGLPTYTAMAHSSTSKTNNQYLKWLNEQENELLDIDITVDELDLYILDPYIPRPEDADGTVLE